MQTLFQPYRFARGLEIRNRFVRSATYEGAASGGRVTDALVDIYRNLAQGRVGLIISSHLGVTKQGQAGPNQLMIECDEAISGLRRLTTVAHEHGACIAAQLNHSGMKAFRETTGFPPLDLNAVADAERAELVAAYGEAARRALAAGFDAVEIHCAHGYLLCGSLSPAFNRRTDDYGGSAENRARLVLDIVRRVREVVGPTVPVLAKVNAQDFLAPSAATNQSEGQRIADTAAVARLLEQAGLDGLELSGGCERPFFCRTGADAAAPYHRPYAHQLREAGVRLPLLLVGGVRSVAAAAEALASGDADLVCMARPFIREPALVARFEIEGAAAKARCVSCNQCFATLTKPMGCVFATADAARQKVSAS